MTRVQYILNYRLYAFCAFVLLNIIKLVYTSSGSTKIDEHFSRSLLIEV